MKKKSIVILLELLLLAVVGVTTTIISAWLTDTDTTGEKTFTVGEVSFTLTGDIKTGVVVPGEELVTTAFSLSNASTITTELRVKMDVFQGETDSTNLFIFSPDSSWEKDEDGYYYYDGSIATDTTTIVFLSSLKLDGSKVGNDYASDVFTITFTFEAKQKDYVTWEELGSTSFETGLAE